MIIGFHVLICLFLIIFQTTVVAHASFQLYDLIGPFVVYLGVYRQPRKAIPVLLLGGLVMDGISGGVFGVYLTAYLWMYVGIRWATQFLHVGNVILLPLLVMAGVLFECLFMAFCALALASSTGTADFVFSVISSQILWGGITGPFLALFFIHGQKAVERAGKIVFSDRDALRNP